MQSLPAVSVNHLCGTHFKIKQKLCADIDRNRSDTPSLIIKETVLKLQYCLLPVTFCSCNFTFLVCILMWVVPDLANF